MDSEMIQETPYIAAMNGEWQHMIDYYQKNSEYLFSPVTLSLDTGFHLAVHSNEEQPLKDLLGIMEGREFFLTETRNEFGNTVLHEATMYRNYEAVILLVDRCPELLWIRNEFGETPLFTAAFGEAEIVEFLIRSQPEQCVDDNGHLLSIHRQRWKDGLSILGAAIIGQHFETALLLLELDESLHSLKDDKDRTALQLLADMPSAFKSAYSMGLFETLFYCCLPVIRHHEVILQVETRGQAGQGVRDLESGLGRCLERNKKGGLLNYLKVPKGFWLQRFWYQKINHVLALRLAKILITKDKSWKSVRKTEEGQKEKQTGEISKAKEIEQVQHPTAQPSVTNSSFTSNEQIPLFLATRNGIEEIVWEIIKLYPHAVEYRNDEGHSILAVAVMHRQKEIFNLVKRLKVPLARLHRVIDKKDNTLLHHVAVMTEHSGGTKPGPAHQLQEELQWFENEDGKTPRELFYEQHKEQLNSARTWIKETTQSCSTVAALVATFVFAAAYTVPGGSDENGKPNLIKSPYFLTFAVADVVSLAFSLTSLTVFLSLLTSRFELQDFHIALPRKLTVGFTFLFLSMMTSMLSFGSTILILIESGTKLTTLLLSVASFLPVLVFTIMQFRLYVSFLDSTYDILKANILKTNWKALPSFLVPCLPWRKKLGPKKEEKSSS